MNEKKRRALFVLMASRSMRDRFDPDPPVVAEIPITIKMVGPKVALGIFAILGTALLVGCYLIAR